MGVPCSLDGFCLTFFFRSHFSRGIQRRPRIMAMHIDPARHHHQLGRVHGPVSSRLTISGRCHHFSVTNPQVDDFPIDFVDRVVKRSIFDPSQRETFRILGQSFFPKQARQWDRREVA